MKRMRIASLALLLLLLIAAGDAAARAESSYAGSDGDCPCRYLGVGLPWSEYAEPAKLAALIDGKAEAYLLVDVRSPEEYASGHIRTAVNIPVDRIADRPPTERKDALIIVYCQGGVRSAKAAAALKALGYEGVVDFGGITRWIGPLRTGLDP